MKVHRLLFIVFYLWNIIVKLRTTRFGATFLGHLSFPRPLTVHIGKKNGNYHCTEYTMITDLPEVS